MPVGTPATPISGYRDWLKSQMDWCFSQANSVMNDALTRSDGSKSPDVFLWRARGVAYQQALEELNRRNIL